MSDLTADEPAAPVQSELLRLAVAVEELTATLRLWTERNVPGHTFELFDGVAFAVDAAGDKAPDPERFRAAAEIVREVDADRRR